MNDEKARYPGGPRAGHNLRHSCWGGFRSALAGLAAVCLWIVAAAPALAQSPPAPSGARPAAISPQPAISSASGILVDAQSGKVLWGKDDRLVRAPASLTKIMTALVVLERADLGSQVTITPQARAARGSRTYAEAGWTFSVRDLLYGLLLPSGNDAAIALAQKVSPDGSIGGFMSMVNQKAADVGATSTHFKNPHGLDEPGHVTSARDMALISLTALRNPTFAQIVATKRHSVKWGDGTTHPFYNHNKLLARQPGTIGVKTGYTNNARHTLVSAVRRGRTTLVAVTLGSPRQYEDSVALSNWGFANIGALRGAAGEEIWPARPASPVPADSGGGSDVVGAALRLLQSLGRSPSTAAGLPIPVYALSSVMAGSAALVGLSAVRSQRRIRQAGLALAIAPGEPQPSPDLPYVSS